MHVQLSQRVYFTILKLRSKLYFPLLGLGTMQCNTPLCGLSAGLTMPTKGAYVYRAYHPQSGNGCGPYNPLMEMPTILYVSYNCPSIAFEFDLPFWDPSRYRGLVKTTSWPSPTAPLSSVIIIIVYRAAIFLTRLYNHIFKSPV